MEGNISQNSQQATGKKKMVLVVEDDQFLARLYESLLGKRGIEVMTVTNGDSAIALLEKDPPRLVLLDLMLPGKSGFDVLTALRANDRWKGIPVVIVSNLGQDQDIKRARDLAVRDYIVKADMKLADIVEKITGYLA